MKFREGGERVVSRHGGDAARRRRPGKSGGSRRGGEINANERTLAPRTNEKGRARRARDEEARTIRSRRRIRGAPPSMERQSRRCRRRVGGETSFRRVRVGTNRRHQRQRRGRGRRLRRNRRRPQRAFGSPTAIVSRASARFAPTPPGPATRVRDLRFLPNASVTSVYGEARNVRAFAHEACVQTCLDGSTGSFVGQSRFDADTWLFFSTIDAPSEAFGLENVLGSTMGQQCATPEMKSRPTLDKEASAEAVSVGAGAGGAVPHHRLHRRRRHHHRGLKRITGDGILANTAKVSNDGAVRMSSFARRAVRRAEVEAFR